MTITIDTHAAVRNLEAAGADPKLAEAIVNTFAQSADELTRKAALTALRADMRADLAQLKQRLTLPIVTIAATANGILFTALRYPRSAT